MSDTTGCTRIRPELGVYVLGAISPADRAMVERHLATCPRCRDEVAELAGIPALLRRVPAAAAMQLSADGPDGDDPEAGLLEGLLRR
jgi:anti-sigma factor RsiW